MCNFTYLSSLHNHKWILKTVKGYLSFNVSLKQMLTSTELRGLKSLFKTLDIPGPKSFKVLLLKNSKYDAQSAARL